MPPFLEPWSTDDASAVLPVGAVPRGRRSHSYAAAARDAAIRVASWREGQRQLHAEEEAKHAPPWFKSRNEAAKKVKISTWRTEALETPPPPRALASLARAASSVQPFTTPSAEEMLNQRLGEFRQLVARLRRFALLNEEVVKACGTRTTAMLETTSLDETRTLFADLLCALRVAIVAVVEAVQTCVTEQTNDAALNLNLPRMRTKFTPALGETQGAVPAPSPIAMQGFSVYSHERHARILCSLTQSLASFLPLPFEQDPLLLNWFDENAEIWQTTTSMPAVKASRAIMHTTTDKKRMSSAQKILLEAIRAQSHGNPPLPRALPAGDRSHAQDAAHAPQLTNADGAAAGTAAAAAQGSGRGGVTAASLPSTPLGGMRPSSSAPLLVPASMGSRPTTAPTLPRGSRAAALTADKPGANLPALSAARHASGRPTSGGGWPTSGGGRPTSGGQVATPIRSRPATAASRASADRTSDRDALVPRVVSAVDQQAEALARAEARGRAMWCGLERLVYGAQGRYAPAVVRLIEKDARDLRERSYSAQTNAIRAIGGILDDETLLTLSARALQRVWRKRRNAKFERAHRAAEHTATLAILSASAKPVTLKHQTSRRRQREHLALIERVAASRILGFFRSPQYQGQHKARIQQATMLQAKARRFLARRRVARARERELDNERKQVTSRGRVVGMWRACGGRVVDVWSAL